MKALQRSEIERYVARPDPRFALVLVYGPDAGLVAERVGAIAARLAADPSDPFQVLRMDGDEIAGDPLRLADEANAASLFGGKKVIRVRVGSRNLAPAVETLAKTPPLDSFVLIEAGDLNRSAPLLTLCEKSPHAALIPCYPDETEDLRRLIDDSLRSTGAQIENDAKEALLAMLGGDRLASRGELEKLFLYVGARKRLSIEDIEAAVGDASAAALAEAVDSAFCGDAAALLGSSAKLAAEGLRPDGLLGAALAQAWSLAQGAAKRDAGQSASSVAKDMVRYFKRQPAFERQLALWRGQGLALIIAVLGDAIHQARAYPDLAASLADRTMLRVALTAKRQIVSRQN